MYRAGYWTEVETKFGLEENFNSIKEWKRPSDLIKRNDFSMAQISVE